MYKICLSPLYGRKNKRIGKFTVTKEWQDCDKSVIEIARPFEGSVFLIKTDEYETKIPEKKIEIKSEEIKEPENEIDEFDLVDEDVDYLVSKETDTIILEPSEEIKPPDIDGVEVIIKNDSEPETIEKEKSGGNKKNKKSSKKKR